MATKSDWQQVRPIVDPEELAHDLRIVVTRLARLLRRQTDAGLSPSRLALLATVERHGRLTLGDLARHERLAPPSVTRAIDHLEADGFVERECDPTDRRLIWVAATPEGVSLLEASRARKDAWLAERLRALDPDRRRRLLDALEVVEALTEGEDP